MVDYKKQGKNNRASGQRFEIKVREDLEKNWIVAKWTNNVELEIIPHVLEELEVKGKLVKVKNKFRGKGIPMMLGAGFPDFIAFQWGIDGCKGYADVIGVEVKSNGYLDKQEKEKCRWLLDNHIFSKILIAKKGKKRGEIIYTTFI